MYHSGAAVNEFAAQHFGEPHRRVLLIGGAGFDPRTLTGARLLARIAGGRLAGFFLREERSDPAPGLLERAEWQVAQLMKIVSGVEVVRIPVFEPDGAVSLGRHAVTAVSSLDPSRYTDIVLDFSALSIGSSFPIIRLLLQRLDSAGIAETANDSSMQRPIVNLHALVTASPITDDRIVPQPCAKAGPVHGFWGRLDLDETAHAARLWMPQLRRERQGELARLYDYLNPHDVVPVLPFPAHDPRLGDRLIDHYLEEFGGRWSVDARSIVYADERNPLDFYRTVLRIDDGRSPVFASTGGSLLLLSPIGSKVLALGAMMAAVERDLPVVYVEALSYAVSLDAVDHIQYTEEDLMHVWLRGEAYSPPSRDRAA